MPKFNINLTVKNWEGKEIKLVNINPDGTFNETGEKQTYRSLIGRILNSIDPKEPDTAEMKNKLGELCVKLYEAKKEVDLTPTQISLIISRAEKFANVLELRRIKEFLGEIEKN